jgi:transcription antitermination factor NusG
MLESNIANIEAAETQFPWFALQVRTKHEAGIAEFLRGRGYNPFLPLFRSRKVWSDRIKVVDAPLFPGYMFCQVNIEDRMPILTAPGVIRIVGYNRVPVPVDEAEIHSLQTLATSDLPHHPWPFLRLGEQFQIESGPLQGLTGILIEVRGTHRLVLSVTLLQRSVAVEIDAAFVKLLSSAGPSYAEEKQLSNRSSQLVGCER